MRDALEQATGPLVGAAPVSNERQRLILMLQMETGHHQDCPTPITRCQCGALWKADAEATAAAEDEAYAQHYDPDWGLR